MKSIIINNIVDSVLLKYKEGQDFFSNLDLSFRNKKVYYILLASCHAKDKELPDFLKDLFKGKYNDTQRD